MTARGWISPLYLPSPKEVWSAAGDIGPDLQRHVLATLIRLVLGFGLGFVCGYVIGLLMVLSRLARVLLKPMVDSGRPAPAAATLPFFLLWFGFAFYGQVLFIAIGVALIIASGVFDSARAVSPDLIRVAQSFRATKMQLARTVIMPGLLPQLVPTLRVALGVAGSLTVISEVMGADNGLGVLMELSRRTLKTESLVLFSLLLGCLVLGCDALLRAYLHYRLRWMPAASDALDQTMTVRGARQIREQT